MPPDRTADAELTRDPQYTVPNRLRCWRTASVSPLSRSRIRGGSRGTCRRPRRRRCRRSCDGGARATVSASPLSVSAVAVYVLALLAMLGASAAHNCGWARAGNELRRRLAPDALVGRF